MTELKEGWHLVAELSRLDYDAVVIGGGPAGVSSAIYLGRAGYKVALIERGTIGGQIAVTHLVENYAGFPGISGPELAANFEKQLQLCHATVIRGEVLSISGDGELEVGTNAGPIRTRCVILATGSSPKRLGVEGEDRLLGRGLSFCAFCDAEFFREKAVAVVGGGDSAIKESAYLSRIASRVYLVHRRDKFRAEKANVELVDKNPKVEMVLNSVVVKLIGENSLESIVVRNVQTRAEREIKVEGIFEYIGRDPNTSIFKVTKDRSGCIVVDDGMMTSKRGVFAAGECTSQKWNQLVVSAGEGAKAAMSAIHYLQGESVPTSQGRST